jgi:hypothetical protein
MRCNSVKRLIAWYSLIWTQGHCIESREGDRWEGGWKAGGIEGRGQKIQIV